jgi:hypothetical protein
MLARSLRTNAARESTEWRVEGWGPFGPSNGTIRAPFRSIVRPYMCVALLLQILNGGRPGTYCANPDGIPDSPKPEFEYSLC